MESGEIRTTLRAKVRASVIIKMKIIKISSDALITFPNSATKVPANENTLDGLRDFMGVKSASISP